MGISFSTSSHIVPGAGNTTVGRTKSSVGKGECKWLWIGKGLGDRKGWGREVGFLLHFRP